MFVRQLYPMRTVVRPKVHCTSHLPCCQWQLPGQIPPVVSSRSKPLPAAAAAAAATLVPALLPTALAPAPSAAAAVVHQANRNEQVQRMAVQAMAIALVHLQVLAGSAPAAELIESDLSTQGNLSQGILPSELSAAGEPAAPKLSSLVSGSNKKQVETCTRRCVPTCTRGGEGAPGLGPLSVRKEIIVFKDGFRSRSYCLSECAQVCSLMINKESADANSGAQQQKQQQQQQQQQQQERSPQEYASGGPGQ